MASLTRSEWRELMEQENESRLNDLDHHLLHIAQLAEETDIPGGLHRYVTDTLTMLAPEADKRRRAPGYRKQKIPSVLRWEVFRRDEFACVSCHSQDDLTADHIHPESAGGETTLANLQTLCRSCNSKKGARV